jgi:hypothetical protein
VWIEDLSLWGGSVAVEAEYLPETPALVMPSDASFEIALAELPVPLLNPPMTGTVGGWTMERTALLATGPTVPAMGTQVSASATDGLNAAFVSFGVSVTGTGTFSQVLATGLMPRTSYRLSVDITVSTGLPSVTHGLRVLAGGSLVATSEEAWTLSLPSDPGELPQPPSNPVDPEQYEALLMVTGLTPGSPSRYTLAFVTDDDPPAGPISLELFAEATGVLASVWFDSVEFTAQNNDPVVFTATGRCGQASHVVVATVANTPTGRARIIEWSEP